SALLSPSLFLSNHPPPPQPHPLPLHDALPIYGCSGRGADTNGMRPAGTRTRTRCRGCNSRGQGLGWALVAADPEPLPQRAHVGRSEEHTSELQSLTNLVCRLLLEKKKT